MWNRYEICIWFSKSLHVWVPKNFYAFNNSWLGGRQCRRQRQHCAGIKHKLDSSFVCWQKTQKNNCKYSLHFFPCLPLSLWSRWYWYDERLDVIATIMHLDTRMLILILRSSKMCAINKMIQYVECELNVSCAYIVHLPMFEQPSWHIWLLRF